MVMQRLCHTFGPVYDNESKVLILGSFPSVKSRETGFYYGHTQNRFWKVIAAILNCKVPQTIDSKKVMLLQNHIALWDVVKSCNIEGSSDSSINCVIFNDIGSLVRKTNIKAVFANGGKAWALLEKYYATLPKLADKMHLQQFPSTSPANAAWNIERLLSVWQPAINAYLFAEMKAYRCKFLG